MVFLLYACKTHPEPVRKLILMFNCGSFEVQEVKFSIVMLRWCGNNYLSCFKLSVPTENRGSNSHTTHSRAPKHSNPEPGMSNMLLWSNLHSMWVAVVWMLGGKIHLTLCAAHSVVHMWITVCFKFPLIFYQKKLGWSATYMSNRFDKHYFSSSFVAQSNLLSTWS